MRNFAYVLRFTFYINAKGELISTSSKLDKLSGKLNEVKNEQQRTHSHYYFRQRR
jgi:hypothetical protein